ncbi:MAG: ParB/RepB/Spo0J family partition protein [Parcubacteria group bacterium]|nr:ParB/RepB/Spo0J family partition protein [Parcubacteria group bacterium]
MSSSPKGLGRGLGSLIPNIRKIESLPMQGIETLPTQSFKTKEAVFEIPVEAIRPNAMQPRRDFSELELAELMESIRLYGVLNPIIVCRSGEDQYELIAGERRWRASKMLGLPTIPALIRDCQTQQKLELALIENIQRKDLNPIEEALSYQKLNDEFNLTHEDIAKRLGKSRSQITNLIRLLNLPEEIRQGLQEGKLTFGHAKLLLTIDDPNEQLSNYRHMVIHQISVREGERLVRKRPSAPVGRDPYWDSMERLLQERLQTKVNIVNKGEDEGKVIIEFYSKEDIEGLAHRLSEVVEEGEE